jgi:Domain of unknown function (DUF3291)
MVASGFHLAQINIATFLAPPDDPANAEFHASLDRINAIADASPGFVWRLVGDGTNHATGLRAFPDPRTLINMSVWTGLAELGAFVYRSGHLEVMRRRHQWFESLPAYMALWWVPAGHIPSVEEGKDCLERLQRLGPTSDAFTFRQPFTPDGAPVAVA